MSEHDYNKILDELQVVKEGLRSLERKIEVIEESIKHDMELTHLNITNRIETQTSRLSLVEKIVFGAITLALVTLLGALLAKVIV